MEEERRQEHLRVFLSALLLATALFFEMVIQPMVVFAAESDSKDTKDRTLSLAVELSYDGEVIEGVEVSLFYVGTVSGDDVVLEGRFAKYAVTTENEDSSETDWEELALTLAGYSYLEALEPEEKDFTDVNGEAFFPVDGETMQEGVYLVLTQTFQQGGVTYTTQPFLVVLPDVDSESITYQVVAVPKITTRIGTQRLTVLKIWEDTDSTSTSRPESVEVTLVNNEGEIWDTVLLSEENSWRYVFTGLPEGYSWYIVENVPAGYTVLQSIDGYTVALINSEDEEEPDTTPSEEETTLAEETTVPEEEETTATKEDATTDSDGGTDASDEQDEITTKASGLSTEDEETTTALTKLPQTGTLWWTVPILACCGMVSVLIGVAKKRGQEEEEEFLQEDR